jgi:hypothetical protein
MDDYGRMSTVLTSTTNTTNVSSLNSDTSNYLKLTIKNEAPAFATKYRVFVKQSKGQYYTIFPNIFYTDGIYTYFMINESDVDKVHSNDYIVFKVNPTGITYSNEQYKVLEVGVKPKDFLGNSKSQVTGVYMKVKTNGITAFSPSNVIINKTTSVGANSARKSSTKCSLSDKTIDPLLNRFGVVEYPIFYGTGKNDLSRPLPQITPSQDCRVTVEIDGRTAAGIDTFRYSVMGIGPGGWAQQNIPITAGTQDVIVSGILICKISFFSSNGHTIGDSWRVNVR